MKIIYPHGVLTESETKEILDFSIECRKRVKDQLRKMDETFNDEIVDFSYTGKNGQMYQIETLEVLEYGDEKLGVLPDSSNLHSSLIDNSESASMSGDNAVFSKTIRDNQTNISYKNLFGEYLKGATSFVIRDPFIRLPYQFRNFIELCRLIAEIKPNDAEIKIHLITTNNEDYIENAKESFAELIDSLTPLGIDLFYEFSEAKEDRSIELDNGWKIVLGRGLDFWQKTTGKYDIAEFYQEKRLCKEFDINVIKL